MKRRSAVRAHRLFDGHTVHDGAEKAARAVEEPARREVDLIKVMAAGGIATAGSDPGSAQYTLAELQAVTRTAH
jgi:hypothetical protein